MNDVEIDRQAVVNSLPHFYRDEKNRGWWIDGEFLSDRERLCRKVIFSNRDKEYHAETLHLLREGDERHKKRITLDST